MELPESLESMPIVDIHTHTFNARYLPLEGIALGKRDIATPLQIVPDGIMNA